MFTKFSKKIALATMLGASTQMMAADLSDFDGKDLYVGFQSSFPSYGLSAKMDLNEKITAQAVIGFLGTVNTYSVRGLYKFKQEQNYNAYGFGSVGLWTWDGGTSFADETVFGFGGGAGVEYDLRGLDRDFIPLFVNLELGLNVANFDNYSFSSLGLGAGLHYKF